MCQYACITSKGQIREVKANEQGIAVCDHCGGEINFAAAEDPHILRERRNKPLKHPSLRKCPYKKNQFREVSH